MPNNRYVATTEITHYYGNKQMKSSLNNRQHEKDCWGNVLSQLFVS
jgi:hypothetical protein